MSDLVVIVKRHGRDRSAWVWSRTPDPHPVGKGFRMELREPDGSVRHSVHDPARVRAAIARALPGVTILGPTEHWDNALVVARAPEAAALVERLRVMRVARDAVRAELAAVLAERRVVVTEDAPPKDGGR